MNGGTAAQTAGTKAVPAQFPEPANAGQGKVVKAEASENLEVTRSAVINSSVKRILLKWTCTLGHEIILKEIGRCRIGDSGSRK